MPTKKRSPLSHFGRGARGEGRRASHAQRRALERARAIALSRLAPRDPFQLRLPTEVTGPAGPREPAFAGPSPLPLPLWDAPWAVGVRDRLEPKWTVRDRLPNPPDPPPLLSAAPPAFGSGLRIQE